MSDLLGLAYLKVKADSAELPADLNRAGAQVQNWMGTLQGWAASALATAGLGVGIGAMLANFSRARDAALSQMEADKRLEAVLIATGHAAGLSAEQLKEHAAAIQAATGEDDDAIQNFQSTLLTFKNVQGDVFKRATELAVDLSKVYEMSLPSVARLLGKALNDPVKGADALSRMMGRLTEAEKKALSQLVATGKGAEAQAMILDKLAGKVGGVAEKSADPYKKAKAILSDTYETLGYKLIPAYTLITNVQTEFVQGLAVLVGGATDVIGAIYSMDEATGHFASTAIAATVATATFSASLGVGGLAGMFPKVIAGIRAMQGAIAAALTGSVWGIPIVAIGLIIGGIVALVNWLSGIPEVMAAWADMWRDLQVAAAYVWETLRMIGQSIMQTFAPAFAYILESWDSFRAAVVSGVSYILREFGNLVLNIAEWGYVLVSEWDTVWELLAAAGEFAVRRLVDVWTGQFMFIIRLADIFVGGLTDMFLQIPETLGSIWDGVGIGVNSVFTAMGEVVNVFWSFLSEAGSGIYSFFKEIVGFLYDLMKPALDAIGGSLSESFNKAYGQIKEAWNQSFAMSPETKAAWDRTTDAAGQLWEKKLAAASNRARFGPAAAEEAKKALTPGKQEFSEAADKFKEKLTGIFGFDELSKRMQESMLAKDDKQQKLVDLGEENNDLQEEQLASSKKTEAGVTKLASMIEVATV